MFDNIGNWVFFHKIEITRFQFDGIQVLFGFLRDMLKLSKFLYENIFFVKTKLIDFLVFIPEILIIYSLGVLFYSILYKKSNHLEMKNSILLVLRFLSRNTIISFFFFYFIKNMNPEINCLNLNSWVFYINDFFNIKIICLIFFLLLYWVYSNLFINSVFSKASLDQFSLFLLGLLCAFLALGSQDIILIGLLLTGLNIIVYSLISLTKNPRSTESSIKYFIMGIASTYLYFLGSLLLWIEYGSISCCGISSSLYSGSLSYLTAFGLLSIFTSFLIKLGSFPYYMWTVDIYDGSTLIIFGFLTGIVKTIVYFVLIKFIFIFFTFQWLWGPLFNLLGVFSVIIGIYGALCQQRIKRFLAYSSINHVGLLLLLLQNIFFNNFLYSYIYYFIYLFSILIIIAILMGIRHYSNREISYFTELNSAFEKIKLWRLVNTVTVLSLAGIPPLNGFFAKYFVIALTVSTGYLVSTFIVLILLPYSIYNYLRIIKNSFFTNKYNPYSKFIYNWPEKALPLLIIVGLVFLTPIVIISI